MYEIKRVEGEDVLKRYNVIKIEIDKAMVHSSREWTAAEIIKHVIAEPNLFQVWEVLEDNTTILQPPEDEDEDEEDELLKLTIKDKKIIDGSRR